LARVQYAPGLNGLLAVTKAGDEVLFELPRLDDAEPLHDHVIVYLDQNQWSAVAKAVHDEYGISQADREAALQLAEWSRQGRITLPASAGHYHETTKRFDQAKRYRLGLCILQLSRGWQMRDPLQVRRDELRTSIRDRFTLPAPFTSGAVFSLSPNALHSPLRGFTPYSPSTDLSQETVFLVRALTAATANIDVMLDPERIEETSDGRWVDANQKFSDWLDGEQLDSQQKRNSIDLFLLTDLSVEIAEEARAAGANSDQVSQWIRSGWGRSISELPATGLFRELTHDRHLNIGTTWRRNDLTDMIYLSCAAGYAHFVICERHMRNGLNQGVKRLGRSTRIFRRLSDAIEPIREALTTRSHSASQGPTMQT
jgi:hypothetical protein